MGENSNVLLQEAHKLHGLGCAVLWLYPASKRPIGTGWTSGPRKSWKELKTTYEKKMNMGVRLGAASKMAKGYLACIDIDVKGTKAHRKEAYAVALKLTNGEKLPKVSSGRGNGSAHLYFQTAEPFQGVTVARSTEVVKCLIPSKKATKKDREAFSEKELDQGWRLTPAWEVAAYSDGRQMVLPPSIHPDSGKQYAWERPLTGSGGDELPVLPVPRALSPGTEIHEGTRSDETLQDFKTEVVDIDWLPISEEVRAGIRDGTGVTDRSAFLLKAAASLTSSGGLTRMEALSVLTDPQNFISSCAYEHAQTKSRKRAAQWVARYTMKEVDDHAAERVFETPLTPARKLSSKEQEKQAVEIAQERDWRQDLDRTQQGKYRATLKNLDLIFTNELPGKTFIEDLFASRIEYGETPPWGGAAWNSIRDIDLVKIKHWLSHSPFQLEPNTASILEAVSFVANRHGVHPVKEWLEGLKWDGKARIDGWIKNFCRGAAPEPYLSEISRKFLLAMVKRVFEPGCQWDYVLVLEGKQGKYKSSAARALAGDRWFMDNLPDLKDKDAMLNLQGKWLIELGELADVKRTDYNLVKAYLTRRTDTVRPHYGRLKEDVPRQSVFIGTINEGQYLKDPTGNRRYWPVKVGLCDASGLEKVRDQLFAEAMHVYRSSSERLMLSLEATKQAVEAQEDRRVDDEESEMRDAFLSFVQSETAKTFHFDKFKIRDLMVGVDAPWGHWNDKRGYILNLASNVLSHLGFQKFKVRGQRFWRKKRGASLEITG